MQEQILRLFVSSPGDVAAERHRLDLVVERLAAEFAGRVRIETVHREADDGSAPSGARHQGPEATECDVVVAVFRGRLGTRPPAVFPTLPSGEPYPSAAAYDVLSAIEVRRGGRRVPDVYVFRYPDAPSIALDAPDRAEAEAQWGQLKGFFDRWFRTQGGEFLAAFQTYGSTEDFAAKAEDCLRQWLAHRGFLAQGLVWDRVLLGSPFPGLAPFEADRLRVFFGREGALAQATLRLREAEAGRAFGRVPFLLLIGASGSGKSSLLRAGLLPRLVLPGTVPEVDLWRVAVMTPDDDPLLALATALFADPALGAELRAGTFRTREILARQLASHPDVALAPLRDALDRAASRRQTEAGFDAPRPARLALGIDQAERLFSEASAGAAAQFAELVAALVRQGLATVVMVLRSDAYAAFQGSEVLLALRESGATLDLVPPTAAELEEIVSRPVAACAPRLSFEQVGGRSLAALLVADARGGDALPLLQVSLARLYAAEAGRGDGVLRAADYSGMDDAVTQTASAAMAAVDAAARAELPALVAGLVADVSIDPRTGVPLPVVVALDREAFEAANPARAALVAAFVGKRLLTAEGSGARPLVRPVHEALLRIWPQAVAILADTASLIQVRHALAPLVRAWTEAEPGAQDTHLDLSPALLDGAQALRARFDADLTPAMRDFIAAAADVDGVRRARERDEQERRIRDAETLSRANRRIARRTLAGLVGALLLAGLGAWQWREAGQQRDRANASLFLATTTATGLVTEGALRYSTAAGIPSTVIKLILDHARRLQDELLSSGEANPELLRSQALALAVSADAFRVMGDAPDAVADATHAHSIMTALRAEQNDDVNTGGVAIADLQMAVVQFSIGELEGASSHVTEALALSEDFARRLPNVAIWREMVFRSTWGLAMVLLAQGDLPGAMKHFEAARDMTTPRIKALPRDAGLKNGLAISLIGIGRVQQEQGALSAALTTDQAALTLVRQLGRAEPGNSLYRGEFAMVQQKIGEVQLLQGDVQAALASQTSALTVRERAVKADPDNAEGQALEGMTRYWFGRVLQAQGDRAGALAQYEGAAATAERLTGLSPNEREWQRQFAVASGWAAAIQATDGNKADGLQRLRQSRDLLADLSRRSPTAAQLVRDLAWANDQLAKLE